MAQKIRISKPGYNVLTETDLDNIVFDSLYDTLKYYASGSVDVTVSGSSVEATVTHNLGYIPFFTCFVNKYGNGSGGDYNMCPGIINDFGVYVYSQVYADTTKLYFKVYTASASNTFTFKYKIFRNNTGL